MLLLLEEFRALGGTAIEVVTGSHTVDQYVEFAKYAHQFGLKASQGSDYHGKGISYMGMGRLPALPGKCIPVWQDWEEIKSFETNLPSDIQKPCNPIKSAGECLNILNNPMSACNDPGFQYQRGKPAITANRENGHYPAEWRHHRLPDGFRLRLGLYARA
jgi:hypothetical protein